jgi:hypothetical protein
MAALNVPTALCGLGRVANSAYKNKNYLELLPLLFIELNSVFMWTCMAYYEIGCYSNEDGDAYVIKGSHFRQGAIGELIGFTIILEPINIFLYTWRFLATLEWNALNPCVKRLYRWFAVITGFAVPLTYYGLFASLVISEG